MKNPLSFGALSLLISTTAMTLSGGQIRDRHQDIRDRIVGAWRLAWLEEQGAAGKTQRADCSGQLVYTHDGHMAVQVMYRHPQAESNVAPAQYAQGGYEASFGTYQIDASHTFTFHVEGALVRTLVGKDLKRVYDFAGNQLIVTSPDPNEHWRVAWERY